MQWKKVWSAAAAGTRKLLSARFERIAEINRKYARPRITMTPLVRGALFFLRFYLLLLVGILIYKFWTLVKQP